MAYVPDPKAKGLDVLVAGWAAAALPDARLEVYGLDPDWARSHLRRAGCPSPRGSSCGGRCPPPTSALGSAEPALYAGGARWEDFGQAPLEALADGALLATVPSGGPFEALRLARELGEPSLIASEVGGEALGAAIRAAFELPEERVRAYRAAALEALRPFRAEAVQKTIERDVLPRLLGPPGAAPPDV